MKGSADSVEQSTFNDAVPITRNFSMLNRYEIEYFEEDWKDCHKNSFEIEMEIKHNVYVLHSSIVYFDPFTDNNVYTITDVLYICHFQIITAKVEVSDGQSQR